MPIVPMKQSITITKTSDSDGWGGGTKLPPVTYKARVDEKTQVVQNQLGAEAVSSCEIMLDKLVDVHYNDDIKYVDELGREIERKPIRIEPIRAINGKALVTVVYL